MSKDGKFKKKKVYFAQVSNNALRDNKLSLKAKGLYALIQSYITIENFTLYKTTLKKQCAEGEKAFESAWKELKDNGYLIQDRHRNTDGSFYYEYELLDVSSHTPKKEGVDKGGGGKGGSYKNTYTINTNISNIDKQEYTISNEIGLFPILENTDNEYIHEYVFALESIRDTRHPRVTEEQLRHIEAELESIEGTDIQEYKEAVYDYIYNLNDNNNGNILSFLKAKKRYFI